MASSGAEPGAHASSNPNSDLRSGGGRRDGRIETSFFDLAVVVAIIFYHPKLPWLVTGVPLLAVLALAGRKRIFKTIPFWALTSAAFLVYSIVAPSPLLFTVFAIACYYSVLVASLFQFPLVARILRGRLRRFLLRLHFTADLVAFFDLPALEIDQDVDGLLVVRGVTMSLSSLTLTVHGVEVGIKLTPELELALAVDQVVIQLFRRIKVGEVYGSIKGGVGEMDFYGATSDDICSQQPFLRTDSAMLEAARGKLDDRPLPGSGSAQAGSVASSPQSRLAPPPTPGHPTAASLRPTSPRIALKTVRSFTVDHSDGELKYTKMIEKIQETSVINRSRLVALEKKNFETSNLDAQDELAVRAATCTEMRRFPTIAHPPANSIKVTTLQNLLPPYVRTFLHRLPLLLRVLLSVLGYFHPVLFSAITFGGSGKFVTTMLNQELFKEHVSDSAAIRVLHERITGWLADANFCLEIVGALGNAQIPTDTSFDITTRLNFDDILLYRVKLNEERLQQVVRLGGADASVSLPCFLLPHHEHILPPRPTEEIVADKVETVNQSDSKPTTAHAKEDLERTKKDCCKITISSHVRLPVGFHPELLEFVAALVKATKIVDMEKDDSDEADEDGSTERPTGRRSLKEKARSIKQDLKHGIHKATVDTMVNDQFIAHLVYKIMKKLESALGDVGYSGDMPLPLEPFRAAAEPWSKLLP